MKQVFMFMTLYGRISLMQSCNTHNKQLTDSDRKEIIEAAKTTVKAVFEYSNRREFINGLSLYAADSNSYYISNGTILSFDELKAAYSQLGPVVEFLNNSIDSWNATVLSKDVVTFTLPIHLKIKLKDTPEYNGQLVWSGIVKKINKKWLIVHSHESWLNCAEVTAALTPNQTE